MIKIPQYLIFLIGIVVCPILDKIATALEKHASETPENWDDVLAGAFRTVVEALKAPGLFEPKTK